MSPGALLRIVEPRTATTPPEEALKPILPLAGIEAVFSFVKNDTELGSFCTLYFLKDIELAVDGHDLYQKDLQDNATCLEFVSWIILSYIDSISTRGELQTPHFTPEAGSIMVANGSTPKDEYVEDYHNWYNQEHGVKLSTVPGWRFGRRYKLEKTFGDAKTASFYGVNFYDQINGLGGPDWKASVTDWTLRIRDQAGKPNVRRVWKLTEAQYL